MKCNCLSHNGFLTDRGLAEVAQRRALLPGVDNTGVSLYLDKVGSVSAMVEVEDDNEYDPLHIELNAPALILQQEMF